jgi:hypothetical protein
MKDEAECNQCSLDKIEGEEIHSVIPSRPLRSGSVRYLLAWKHLRADE